MKPNNAFTLVEILLVIIIAGVILALAVPNFSKGYSRFQVNKTADDLLDCSRWAQAMAIGQGRIYALSFSGDHHSYGFVRAKLNDEINDQVTDVIDDKDNFEPVRGTLGKIHVIPDLVTLDTQNDRVEFYPDGTIDSAVIKLTSSDKKIELSTAVVRGMMTKVNSE